MNAIRTERERERERERQKDVASKMRIQISLNSGRESLNSSAETGNHSEVIKKKRIFSFKYFREHLCKSVKFIYSPLVPMNHQGMVFKILSSVGMGQ